MKSGLLACVCAVVATAIFTTVTAAASASRYTNFEGVPLAALPDTALSIGASPLLAREFAVLTGRGLSPDDAMRALQAQDRIARADLPNRLQAATGAGGGGVWFDPASARLHVGVTSTAARGTAAASVAAAGLGDSVTLTPVRSTIAQLLATQRRWNRKLARLLANGEVATALQPQHNAVSIKLSASVPAARRAALQREAAAASVNVLVTVAPSSRVGLTPLAETKCTKFSVPWEKHESDCDRPLTSGVAIKPNGVTSYCSAGPLTYPPADKTARLALTAGHCIAEGGVNPLEVEWAAFNTKAESSVIGKPEKFSFGAPVGTKIGATEANYCGGICTGGDFGDIKIGANWQTGMPNNPVYAGTALWGKKTEKSYPVKGERTPVVGNANCHEGQTSGESCATITALNLTIGFKVGAKIVVEEGLIEDTGEELSGGPGDSGGPWLFVETSNEALMEGTLVGVAAGCVKEHGFGFEYFTTLAECQSQSLFKEEEEKEGEWRRMEYECIKRVGAKKGPNFYPTKARCEEFYEFGEGEWERKPELHIIWEPLKQPVMGASQGSLEALDLDLLTTANEITKSAPFWSIGGARLESGKTHNIVAKAAKEEGVKLEAKALGASIKCTKVEAKSGSLSGSSEGEPGTAKTTMALSSCTTTGNGEGCKVKEPLESKALKAEQVTNSTAKKLETLFSPETGETLMTLGFEGAKCTLKETTATGQWVAEDVTDPGEEAIEIESASKEATSWNLRFPTTAVTEVTKYKAGKEEKAKVKELRTFGFASVFSGVVLVSLTEEPKWSPLP